jgi:hypothetical protein
MKITRRGLAQRSLAGLMAAPAALPVPALAQAPAPAAPAIAAAHARFQNHARELARVKLPRNIEPAARFEA